MKTILCFVSKLPSVQVLLVNENNTLFCIKTSFSSSQISEWKQILYFVSKLPRPLSKQIVLIGIIFWQSDCSWKEYDEWSTSWRDGAISALFITITINGRIVEDLIWSRYGLTPAWWQCASIFDCDADRGLSRDKIKTNQTPRRWEASMKTDRS